MLALSIEGRKAEDYHAVLNPADIAIMDATRAYNDYIPAMERIMKYSKTRLVAAIDKNVVKHFNDCGVCIFGKSVHDAKVLIPRFLDEHPACKDSDPTRCFNKILYWLAYDWNLANVAQPIAQG